MLVFGTRPEAIKMAPLVKEFQKYPDKFRTTVCVTGQHREMLDQVLNIFDIIPDYDLNIMKSGQDLYDITSRILLGMRDVFSQAKPDIVMVHGDTTTSMAVALAAFYQQMRVGHVEAGLRTNNIYSPWPEEMNRQITGRIATYHFSPTSLGRDNLLQEGVHSNRIWVTGNTVIDALYAVLGRIKHNEALQLSLRKALNRAGYDVDRVSNEIEMLSTTYPDVDFVYPMHLNPNVRKPIEKVFNETPRENLFFIEPLDYLPFVYLMKKSSLVLTDSGGIQEEAPSLGKPVLVMRDTTERPEALDAGTVKLVGTDCDKIISEVSSLLEDKEYYRRMSRAINPYGDGRACERIVSIFSLDG